MKLLIRVKSISAILLFLCIFLPLSQCTTVTQEGEMYDTVQYAYTAYKWPSIGSAAILLAMSWPLAFFVTSLAYRGVRENIYFNFAEFALCLGSGYVLFILLIFQTKLLVGGYLAVISICAYFASTVTLIVWLIRSRRQEKKHNKSLNQIGAKDAPPG